MHTVLAPVDNDLAARRHQPGAGRRQEPHRPGLSPAARPADARHLQAAPAPAHQRAVAGLRHQRDAGARSDLPADPRRRGRGEDPFLLPRAQAVGGGIPGAARNPPAAAAAGGAARAGAHHRGRYRPARAHAWQAGRGRGGEGLRDGGARQFRLPFRALSPVEDAGADRHDRESVDPARPDAELSLSRRASDLRAGAPARLHAARDAVPRRRRAVPGRSRRPDRRRSQSSWRTCRSWSGARRRSAK